MRWERSVPLLQCSFEHRLSDLLRLLNLVLRRLLRLLDKARKDKYAIGLDIAIEQPVLIWGDLHADFIEVRRDLLPLRNLKLAFPLECIKAKIERRANRRALLVVELPRSTCKIDVLLQRTSPVSTPSIISILINHCNAPKLQQQVRPSVATFSAHK